MLSQYSWWDFAKVTGTILVIYYAYVLWAYYREDIREWISNRGNGARPTPDVDPQHDDDQIDSSILYSAKIYNHSSGQQVLGQDAQQSGVKAEQSTDKPDDQPRQSSYVELGDAPVLSDSQPSDFELAIGGEVIRPDEVSLAELQQTAKGLVENESGIITAINPDDKKATSLAEAINQQRGATVFGDMQFNR